MAGQDHRIPSSRIMSWHIALIGLGVLILAIVWLAIQS
jgi:hypothetical protein